MEINYFFKGILIGFSIAAPVGPIGILTIGRSLKHGPLAGLATGLGAAAADAVYGCVAGFGLTFISGFLLAWNTQILWMGSLFLCWLGLAFLIRSGDAPQGTPQDANRFSSHPKAFLSAFFLTLTNPMTIMAFTAIFAGLGLTMAGDNYLTASLLVSGVFSGSALWWIILSFGAGKLKERMGKDLLGRISRVAGVVLLGFGAWSVIRLAT
ncbi:MAG TPA: lysine transporter LysE [Desulfobacteraceae bacterium]|nr:lysine transporter LysE [Desulfobacteraceae bacterium]